MKISAEEAISYRTPLYITKILMFLNGDCFPVCPRCQLTLEREYQNYCDRCGQCLSWTKFSHAKIVKWKPRKT